ncbi:MAG: type II secretion system GspH family protein [bacterium]|nr:type II secretion system GspH family protein [bacterium]
MLKKNKAFTLIELLIVISIVGILSSIVLVSLSEARKKGGDGGIKSNLLSVRSQAEVFYNNNSTNPLSYTSVCTNGTVGGVPGVGSALKGAAEAASLSTNSPNLFADDAASSSTQAVCNDSSAAWAAEVPLQQGGFWCVDSLSTSKYFATSGLTAGTDYICN